MGFSDITALHIAFLEKCGLATIHGPMATSNWASKPLDPFSLEAMYRILMQASPAGELSNPPEYAHHAVQRGRAEGLLVGGNLSLIVASLGTPWEIDTRGKILFLEDIGEKTYRVDSMLTQLRNAGKFRDCAGIILGAWTDCPPEYPEKTLLLPEIFAQLVAPAGKPCIADVACGHVLPTMALPMGRKCCLNADEGTIILE